MKDQILFSVSWKEKKTFKMLSAETFTQNVKR